MHIIIVGAGRVGTYLAKGLSEEGHDVVMIDKSKERCERLASELNAVVLHGDATDKELLEEAGIKRADVFVAATGDSEDNLFACLVAKNYSKARLIIRSSDREHERVFRELGIHTIISPEETTASQIHAIIENPDVVDLAMIHRGDIEMIEFEVGQKSKVLNKTIHELDNPRNSMIVAIKEGSRLIIPHTGTKLRLGEKVIVICKKNVENKVRKLFV